MPLSKFKGKYKVMLDLLTLAGGFSPAEHGNIGNARKMRGATTAMEAGLKEYTDQADKIEDDKKVIMDKYQPKLSAIQEEIAAEPDSKKQEDIIKKRDALQVEANKELKPFVEHVEKLEKEYKDKEAECEMDGDHFAYLQDVFKRLAHSKYRRTEDYLEAADALGVKE